MRSMTPVLLIFAAAACRSVWSLSGSGSGSLQPDYVPVCNAESYSQTPNPPFPALPDQFYTAIELSGSRDVSEDSYSNYSFIMSEHYDYPGNRGRIDWVSESGDIDLTIFDYNLGEAFIIPDREREVTCGVISLSEPSSFLNSSLFGYTYVDGRIHIGSVRDMFDLAENQSAKNCPQKQVRGILCNCWETCHVFENSSYKTTYFFASNSWNYYYPEEAAIPVQVDVCATFLDSDGTLNEFRHTYSLFGFHSGPSAVPDSVFEVPTGLPCLGRIPGKGLPDVPPYFSMLIETVWGVNAVETVREFYDSQLFRIDYSSENTPYSIIHDFDLGIQYIINRQFSNCSVQAMSNLNFSPYDITTGPNGTTRLRTPTEFFRVGTGYNFSYEGETKIRGISADAWISVRDSFPLNIGLKVVNGTVELFYSQAGSSVSSLLSTNTDPIPLAINVTGTRCLDDDCQNTAMTFFSNIYDFSTQEPDFDVFDTSFCADPGQYKIISIKIPGREFGAGIGQLRRSIRLGLTQYAKLPLLQVANIEILGEDGTYIYATLQILPVPSVANYPDPRSPDDIVQSLFDNTTSDDCLPFTVQLPSGGGQVRPCWVRVDPVCPVSTTPTVTLVPSTTTEQTPSTSDTKSTNTAPTKSTNTAPTKSTNTAPTKSTTSTSKKPQPTECPGVSSASSSRGGVSGGAVAAISIVMFIVGMICTMVLVLVVRFCRSRRGRFSLIHGKYRRQENEMEGFAD